MPETKMKKEIQLLHAVELSAVGLRVRFDNHRRLSFGNDGLVDAVCIDNCMLEARWYDNHGSTCIQTRAQPLFMFFKQQLEEARGHRMAHGAKLSSLPRRGLPVDAYCA